MSLLRVAAINFLNPAPLMWDFEHEPGKSRLALRYSIHQTTPAGCADELMQGNADIGLVPVATYAFAPSMVVLPGCAIASLGDIRSIILVVRHPEGVNHVRSVALDTSSRTSATYTRILFHKYWNAQTTFLSHAPDLEAMLQNADAALLIGDPALLALEDRIAREQRTGEKLQYLDLGHEWHALTGTAWVSAFWAARPEGLQDSGIAADAVVSDFQQSRDHGLEHIDDLVAEWSGRLAVPSATIHEYLTRNIHYRLDDASIEGLRLFYRYAAECGALPATPDLRFL
ncbi:menaquinone biosynthetic enzyme MqnA/MqnD family protein [Acidobacterium sp. S8]|uniref:menaquinone biosynthetic enzyme MqnA/MqnD family protein n=1 Tax=Acidobacterium sp. S8 TaxID=1641854 RepID=UPI00131E39FA|nr:menaquinone biosynthesis protein [Acidobacterium sp. S8]